MTAAEEVKQKLDLIEVVGEYVRLQPAGGQSLKGLCPFHGEKTPSFYAHRDKQFWHCFGCGEGGDLFTFYEKIENVDFRDALKELARRAGVQLPEFDPKADSERAGILAVLEDAARFYEAALKHAPTGDRARAYLTRRGVKDETIAEFRLGYAPATWDSAVKALQGKGHAIERIMAAGLAVASDRNRSHYDRFRDRVMIPLRDEKGTVVGFTGRILPDNPEAEKTGKYVNTPETIVYQKRKMLFGFDLAKKHIKASNFAILVEGNLDVISSHQAGVKNVIGISGTSLTDEQIRLMSRLSNLSDGTLKIGVRFDADNAGQKSMTDALMRLWSNDIQVFGLTLPAPFKDPDELIRADTGLWHQVIRDSKDWILLMLEFATRDFDRNQSLAGRRTIKRLVHLFEALKATNNEALRDYAMKKLHEMTGITEEAIRSEVAFLKSGVDTSSIRASSMNQLPAPAPKIETREERLAARLLCLMLSEDGLFSAHIGALDDRFPEGPMRDLARFLKAQYTESGKAPSLQALQATAGLPPIGPILLLKDRDMAEWSPEQLSEEAIVCARELEKSATKRTEKELVGALAEAEQRGDRATATQIAKRLEDVAKRSHN